MSSLSLLEVTTKEELDELTLVQFAANHTPYINEYQLFHPIIGATEEDRERCIKEDQDRRWEDHVRNGDKSRWIYVRDDATGAIIGGCEWQVYRQNPFPNGVQPVQAPWWPDGEGRRFAELFFNSVYKHRQQFMRRPHVCQCPLDLSTSTYPLTNRYQALNAMGVHPSQRGRGAGRMLMDWGVRKADEMNVEMFIEAKPPGRRLYEHAGLRSLYAIYVDMDMPHASDAWRAYQGHLGVIHIWILWRPKQGVWREDGPKGPWDVMAGLE